MHVVPFLSRAAASVLLALILAPIASAQEAGETVVKQGVIKEDIYVAGGTVDVNATAGADVVAAGGTVSIGQQVQGDVIAAGGTVNIRAKVADDVRAAGGNVTVEASIGDDVILAGGSVTLTPGTTVGGRAWLAGGSLNIAGKIGKSLKAAGGNIIVSAQIAGDADLTGEKIEIGQGAVISGNVRYHSPIEVTIHPGAKIVGTVTRDPLTEAEQRGAGALFAGYYISLMVACAMFFLLFPVASVGAAQRIRQSPWVALGLGLALLAATPLVIFILFTSVIGVWVALVVLALYFVLLLLGYLTGVIFVGDALVRQIRKRKQPSKGWRVISIVLAFLVLASLGLIPLLGGLVCFTILLLGMGALVSYCFGRYQQDARTS